LILGVYGGFKNYHFFHNTLPVPATEQTSHIAVMLCGWGVKAGMALQVKLSVATSDRFGKCYSI